jgi:hypothetical protein
VEDGSGTVGEEGAALTRAVDGAAVVHARAGLMDGDYFTGCNRSVYGTTA